jgi:hypothetical protein
VSGEDNAWGLGFSVSDDGYGMGGLGGNYAGTSTEGGYSIGFVTGSVGSYDRVGSLENTLRECLAWRPSRPPAIRLRIAEMTPSGAAAPESALRRQIIQIGAPA